MVKVDTRRGQLATWMLAFLLSAGIGGMVLSCSLFLGLAIEVAVAVSASISIFLTVISVQRGWFSSSVTKPKSEKEGEGSDPSFMNTPEELAFKIAEDEHRVRQEEVIISAQKTVFAAESLKRSNLVSEEYSSLAIMGNHVVLGKAIVKKEHMFTEARGIYFSLCQSMEKEERVLINTEYTRGHKLLLDMRSSSQILALKQQEVREGLQLVKSMEKDQKERKKALGIPSVVSFGPISYTENTPSVDHMQRELTIFDRQFRKEVFAFMINAAGVIEKSYSHYANRLPKLYEAFSREQKERVVFSIQKSLGEFSNAEFRESLLNNDVLFDESLFVHLNPIIECVGKIRREKGRVQFLEDDFVKSFFCIVVLSKKPKGVASDYKIERIESVMSQYALLAEGERIFTFCEASKSMGLKH
jgi:hypothetical protein